MNVAKGQIIPDYMSAGADYAGFGVRGLWLIFVYWVAISLTVMILGAHQFHLKVAARASAHPGSDLTIGELIGSRTEYRARQDAIEALELERRNKLKEIALLEESRFSARARLDAMRVEAYSAARNLALAVLAASPVNSDGASKPTIDFKSRAPVELAEWARSQPPTPETSRLADIYGKAEQRWQVAESDFMSAKDRVGEAQDRLGELDMELKTKTAELREFLSVLQFRDQQPGQVGAGSNGSNIIGLLYELDSFRNLEFFWLGQIDPLKFVTLPGSVLTLLLALAMGALGSTLFVTGEYFRPDGMRTMAWYFFRPSWA